jgi:hypothetical protein
MREAIHECSFADRMWYPVWVLPDRARGGVLVHPLTDDFELKALLPLSKPPGVNGNATVAMSSHANGESLVMLQIHEPTGCGVLFLRPDEAEELARQIAQAAARLKNGTIKVSFVPTASHRSSP